MELPRRITYNPRWWSILMAATFFGVCSAFMAHKATHNSAGLILNGVITLGPTGANIFYWIIAGLGAGFVLMAILLTARRLASPQILELGTDALQLPHGWFQRRSARIPYADIQGVSEIEVSGQRFVYLTVGGLRYTIVASLLPDKDSYIAVRDFLKSHVPR